MFTHVVVGSNDVERSRRFYDAVLGTLGHGNVMPPDQPRLFYRAPDGAGFMVTSPANGEPACHANGGTIGFSAKSSAEVDAFHAAGLANGGSDEGAPGPRPVVPGSYGGYLRDPDGNKICCFAFDQA